ncbi:MAG: sigma-54-dependent Fis family transcriptional regulator [Desulfobacteraceae bacterium]|nr:MAG: sigma-54-dependent Fis family transcriptional regulator [Desulfobacteraceae bacterium]
MKILLVEDEPDVSRSLGMFLQKLGYEVRNVPDGESGLREFHAGKPDLVITDIRMPNMSGLELLRRIKIVEKSPVDVIVITGHGDLDNAVTALKYGAFDYLQKPVNVKELAIAIERSREYTCLRNRYLQLRDEFNEKVENGIKAIRGEAEQLRRAYLQEVGLDEFCFYSEAMCKVVRAAETYSMDRSIPVLVEGESGTGKEVIARYIHYFSVVNMLSPFIALNSASLNMDLFESELLGHEPGAFTGALRNGRPGKLEAASGGTVFLDEVSEMPLQLQAKLLRVIEEKRFFRIGGLQEIPVDVRFICASNRSLRQAVEEKQFRLDLYYRIAMGYIHVPPLRDRKDDIMPLAHRFAQRAFKRRGKRFQSFSPDAESFLLSFSWPGNVRQLKNTLERVALMNMNGFVEAGDISFLEEINRKEDSDRKGPFTLGSDPFQLPPEGIDLDALVQKIIKDALTVNKGNQSRTARYLGMTRRALQGKLMKMSS